MTNQPTVKQALTSLRVCQMLSTLYQDIHLFRYDSATQEVYILAGKKDELEIVIYSDGTWEFVNGAEFQSDE